jgi:hypothetical protein
LLPRQHEHRRIAHADAAAPQDGSVQRQITAKAPANVPQDLGIAIKRVRIDRRHRTAAAQRVEPHDHVTNMQFRAGPLPFSQPLNTADEHIRTESPHIPAERGDGSVCRDE